MANDVFERAIEDAQTGTRYMLRFDFEVPSICEIQICKEHRKTFEIWLDANPVGVKLRVFKEGMVEIKTILLY